MALFTTALNSGSNGNCYYVGNNIEAVLIDAGISCRETEKRMLRLGLSIKKVKAIFISHEHDDHINGAKVLSQKHQLPVYITKTTLQNCRFNLPNEMVHHFTDNDQVNIGNLTVSAFSKLHDASDPHSFTVKDNEGVCVGIFTDIGKACEQVIFHFKQCHAAYLEANYDSAMLDKGNYPYHLKRRISGGNGHLSNAQALELFKRHRSDKLSHLILSHLSKNNNSPELVENTFADHAGTTKIIVASRFKETEVFQIIHTPAANENDFYKPAKEQSSLFKE
ncbi:MAG: MBL fold metallo-hydrolase [Bacteroidetes bacterium]|nr:MBL fold metallo-hydrolase [Bacteroidota bacterium]